MPKKKKEKKYVFEKFFLLDGFKCLYIFKQQKDDENDDKPLEKKKKKPENFFRIICRTDMMSLTHCINPFSM